MQQLFKCRILGLNRCLCFKRAVGGGEIGGQYPVARDRADIIADRFADIAEPVERRTDGTPYRGHNIEHHTAGAAAEFGIDAAQQQQSQRKRDNRARHDRADQREVLLAAGIA